ncbi:SRPBCC family protein [Pseudonocardia sp. KRD291]|uniref:SRPBCC family protein n=1 Tax=Pseudonocardia sp. KRD291 TaxID=2792007 RepID=UPI001C49ED94|nr:SRPBCC family protein [Pseudonocardia sp. KRD291]MBW0102210.1 SRPBCC family protein [Pseudonocardia sp. KRD291]
MTTIDTPAGTVTREPHGLDTLLFRREYPDPPALVWPALTESDRLARWFGSFTGDARPGGLVELTMTSAEDSGGPPSSVRVVECDPPHRLAVSIEQDGSAPWEIVVTLADDASGGTVLHFAQTLPAGFSPADVGPGWHWYLDRLGATLSGGTFPDWADYPALASRYS